MDYIPRFITATFITLLIVFSSCNSNGNENEPKQKDTVAPDKKSSDKEQQKSASPSPVYSNKRFKNVTVEKTGAQKFFIKGEAQIFEASFGWVIEDGHNELNKGFEMTDAGAPAWGNFAFTIEAKKVNPNSTLHLILFETSAKDGSRQYELPILLY